jgi:hypothetical protein
LRAPYYYWALKNNCQMLALFNVYSNRKYAYR